jgi:putative transposase
MQHHNVAWPASTNVRLTLPPAFRGAAEELQARVAEELLALERSASADVKARGFRILGAKCVTALSPFKRARSWEPLRGRNPTFAVGRGHRDAFFHAVAALRQFRSAYRTALEAWRQGVRSVRFPFGTYLMSWLHGASVAEPS